MKNWAILWAAFSCVAGCRAPMPQMKDLSPYGATRVEPPQTGSFGTADAYYQPPTATGSRPAPNARSEVSSTPTLIVTSDAPAAGTANDNLPWRAPSDRSARADVPGSSGQRARAVLGASTPMRAVAPVGYEEEVGGGPYAPGSTLSIIAATPPPGRAANVKLNGMPINDATQLAEPAAFTPQGSVTPLTEVRDITDLPEPNETVRARLRSSSAAAAEAGSGSSASSNSNAAVGSGGWRLR